MIDNLLKIENCKLKIFAGEKIDPKKKCS